MSHDDCTCDPKVHETYDKMVEAIQNFMRARGRDENLLLTDWIFFGAAASLKHQQTFYSASGSPSPPHIREGLHSLLGRDLIDEHYEL